MSQWAVILVLLAALIIALGVYRIVRAVRDSRKDPFLRHTRRGDDDLSTVYSAVSKSEQANRVLREQNIGGAEENPPAEVSAKPAELKRATEAEVIEEGLNSRLEPTVGNLRHPTTRANENDENVADTQAGADEKIAPLEQSAVGLHTEPQDPAKRPEEPLSAKTGSGAPRSGHSPPPRPETQTEPDSALKNGEGTAERVSPNGHDTTVSRRPIDPINRGGHPHTSGTGATSRRPDVPQTTQRRRALPVARYVAGGWALFLDCEVKSYNIEKIVQKYGEIEQTIDRDANSGLFGPIKYFNRSLTIVWRSGQSCRVDLIGGSREALAFRCVGEERAELVGNPRRGLYLVLAPKDWIRDEELGGRAPIADQDTWDPEFNAYFFDLDHGSVIAFHKANGERWTLGRATIEIGLEGRTIEDVEQRMGPLFVEVPTIVEKDSAPLRIHSLVIGEAGKGRGLWRSSLPTTGTQTHLGLIAARGCGWYFVRAYDEDDQFLDSFVFRYAPGLNNFRVEQVNDGPEGRERVRVSFSVNDGTDIYPDADGLNHLSDVDPTLGSQRCEVFEWSQRPDWRYMCFWVKDLNGHRVPVCLDVDCVWWALREEVTPPTAKDWIRDTLTRNKSVLEPTSDVCLWLRLPRRVLAKTPRIRFGGIHERQLTTNANGVAKLMLNSFSDALDTSEFGRVPMTLSVDGEDLETPLEILIEARCRQCKACFDSTDKLVDHVVRRHHDDWFEMAKLRDVRVFPHGIPKGVYICNQCQKLYPESPIPAENANTLIMQHIEKEHPDAPHAFTAVHDRDQILAIYERNQRSIWYCRACGRQKGILPDPKDLDAGTKKHEHLLDEHSDELWTACEAG